MKQKGSDGLISRYINRRFSSPISNYLVKHYPDISPNTITLIIFLISLAPLILFLKGQYILAGIMIQVSSILDGIDGEVARTLGKTSRKGAILDAVLDRIVNTTFYLGAMLYLHYYTGTNTFLIIILGTLALSGDLLVSYIHSKFTEITGLHPTKHHGFPNIASRDIRLFIFFILTLLNQVALALAVIAGLSYTYTMGKLITIMKNYDETKT